MTVMIQRARSSSRRARWSIAALGMLVGLAVLALWPLAATATHPQPQLPLTAPAVEGLSDCAPPAPDTGTPIPTGTQGTATTPPDRNNTSSSNEHTPIPPATVEDFVIHANAESDPKENTLDISGSHNVFDGLIDTRSHLKISGSWNLLRHGTEYGRRSAGKVAFDLTGSNNCFSPIPTQEYEDAPPASPAGFPLSENFDPGNPDGDGNILEHFAPGTTAANNAIAHTGPINLDLDPTKPGFEVTFPAQPLGRYFVCGIPATGGARLAPGCSGSGASAIMDRNVQGQVIEPGLYFVTGRVKLSASNLNAMLTVVSGQQLNVNGSFQGQGFSVFRPYTDASGAFPGGLLFASQWDEAASLTGAPDGKTFPDGGITNDSPNTDKAEDALKIEGSLSRFEGIIVATNGRTEIAGEQLDFRCPVMGDRVRVNGSKNYFNASGCVAKPNVSIDKLPDGADVGTLKGTISAGDLAVFRITISNPAGAGTATNLDIEDTLPGTGWVESPDVPECTIAPNILGDVLHCDVASLAGGASFSVTVQRATSTADCAGDVVGNAGVRLDNGSITGTPAVVEIDDSQVDSDPGHLFVNCPDVAVVKTPDESNPAGPANDINAGEDAVFTITFTNNGPGTASTVGLNDQLPTANGLDWSIVSQGFGPGFSGGSACSLSPTDQLTCTVNDMASPASYRVVVKSATTAAACGSIPNTVTITPAGDINPANNSDTGEIDVACPDIQVEKTPDGGPAGTINAGDAARFTIVVSNSGAGTASGVTLSDDLPNDGGLTWTLTSATKNPGGTNVAAQCTTLAGGALPNGNELDCNFGNLTQGQSVTVVLTSSATTSAGNCGDLENGNGELDNGLNSTDTADDAIADATNDDPDFDPGQIIVACPNVTVDKTPDGGAAGTIDAGSVAVFTVVVSNSGAGTATGVTLSDDLPNDGNITWSLTSATKNPGGTDVAAQCTTGVGGALPNGNELDCAFGDLTTGQSVTLLLSSSKNTAATCGELANGNGELDNGLNTASTADDAITDATNADPDEDPGQIIVACPSLTVDKTPDGGVAGTIDAGDAAVFTIVASNSGPGTANGVTLSDDLPNDGNITWSLTSAVKSAPPAGGTNVAAGCDQGAGGLLPVAKELDCDFGSLAPGQTITVVVTSSATSSAGNCGELADGNGVLDNGLATDQDASDDAIADASNDDPDEDPGQIIVACPDVSVAKSPDETDPAGPANDINAGQAATFTILVTNSGPGVASSVPLSDQLPTANGLDWSFVSQGLGPGFSGGTACTLSATDLLECSITNLAKDGQYQIVVTSATSAANCGTIPNTVTITPAGDIDAANDSDTGEIDVTCAAIRILKQSTKQVDGVNVLVRNPGAVFSVDGPDADAVVDFGVRDDNDPVHAAPGKADEVTTMGVGIVCVSGLAPGAYTVNETTPPFGYGASSQTGLSAVAASGTNCTDSLPTLGNTAVFKNPPLADIQVRFKDGGSGETSLTVAGIDCAGLGTSPDTPDAPSLANAPWTTVVTHAGIPIDPSPRAITCVIDIDP